MSDLSLSHPPVEALLNAFNDALNRRDLPAMLALLTPDTVFENTYPPPDGERFSGLPAVAAYWEQFFFDSQSSHIEIERLLTTPAWGVQQWTYHWTGLDSSFGHIRGIDLFLIRDGLIAAKYSYVKG
jgi:hypothetical protein